MAVPKAIMVQKHIYILRDPRDDSVRYVGKSEDPHRRYLEHLRRCKVVDTPCNHWIAELEALGLVPTIEVVETTATDDWQSRERHWVSHFRDAGEPLTNVTGGGFGHYGGIGLTHSAASREKMRRRKMEMYAASNKQRDALSRMHATLTDEQVLEIWRLATTRAMTQQAIADMFGIHNSIVSEIKTGKRYKHVPRPQGV